ncbi:MAG: tRNA (guanosine(46)-N7)-methyltransferase TrmB [unclassified Hahellaceae]|nr:tRNA (guanosine(46)-N7)-methyltransferase TrmB [Hahellaceae bacterium]|tara:strand:+ start:5888 stop:6637 length:750 start_codon:yes stop_codon:yes gene_type:complete
MSDHQKTEGDQSATQDSTRPESPEAAAHPRRLKSFVIRSGRKTAGQQAAYDTLWPKLGLDPGTPLRDSRSPGRESAPLVIEVGFGMGQSLAEMALAAPETDFVGIEVHPPGVGSLCLQIHTSEIGNIRIYQHDAVEVFEGCVDDASVDRIQVYFPDPWHKKRHHKRRLIQPEFTAMLSAKLKPGGLLHLATDWEHYAHHMYDVLAAEPTLENLAEDKFVERPEWRPETKFERRGQKLGHGVYDLLFRKR